MKETRFKQTEIGLIPKDWNLLSVGKDCTVKARIGWQGLTTSEYMLHGNYALITSTDIVNGKINWSTCFFVTKFRYEQDKNIIIKAGDILVSKDGTIGKVGIVSDMPYPATLNSGVFVIRTKNTQLQYATALAFISPYFKDFIKRLTAGSTIVHLYQKDIVKFVYPVSNDINEQNKIASALTSIDNLLLSLDKLIEKKKLIKQGTMQELLTGKKRLPGFTGEWVERKLGDFGKIIMGQSPLSEYYNNNQIGLPLIQGNADLINRKQIIRIYTSNITKICDINDIILSVRAPVGSVGKASMKSCIGRGVCCLKNKEEFLFQYLIWMEDKWDQYTTGSTFDSISSNELINIPILIPEDIYERFAIANILSSMDKEIELLECKKTKYEQIKQGMMQQLLTGKIRLI